MPCLLLIACCFWSSSLGLEAPAFHKGLTMNTDITTCPGDTITISCRHRIAGLDAHATIYFIPEESISAIPLNTAPLPGLPSSELLSHLNGTRKIIREGPFRHIKSAGEEYSEFALDLKSVRRSDAGVYLCMATTSRWLAFRYTKVSTQPSCNRSSHDNWYLGIIAALCVLLICVVVSLGWRRFVKNSKPRVRRLISISHPERTDSISLPRSDRDSGISQCSHYFEDHPKAVASPHVQFEQVPVPVGVHPHLRSITRSTRKLKIKGAPNAVLSSRNVAQESSQEVRPLKQLDTRFISIYRIQPDPDYEIPRENLTIGSYLGSGAFGVVHIGTARDLPNHPPGQIRVAVKTLTDNFTEDDVIDLLKEMDIMKQLRHHKHVIRLLAVCTQNGAPYLVMEYAPHGNLRNYLCANRAALEQSASIVGQLLNYGLQVAEGMEFLSSRSIIHRDLAARNILVGEDYVLKIADFGLTRTADDYYRQLTGGRLPIKWLAPECIFDRVYTMWSDVWSFGVLLWEVFSLGDSPFKDIDPATVPRIIREGRRNPKPRFATEEIYGVMLRCWETEPCKRLSFVQLVATLTMLKREQTILFSGPGNSSTAEQVNSQSLLGPHLDESGPHEVHLDSILTESFCTEYTKLVADVPLISTIEHLSPSIQAEAEAH